MYKFLVVDDEPLLVKGIKFSLENDGHNVDVAYNGDEALKKILSQKYDLVLLDLMLPKKDGFEVCMEARKQVKTPIIFLSARGEDISKIRGLDIGADDYITKPFNIMELKSRINAVLRRSNKILDQKNMELETWDLKIHLLDHKVYRGEKELNLTQKEYEILSMLIQNPNKIFSREMLHGLIWNNDKHTELRTVDVHIRKLREKIEKESSNPKIILTKWGEGYYYEPEKK